MDRKFKISVLFDLFLVLFRVYLHLSLIHIFLIYLLFLLIMGIPVLVCEFAIGRASRYSIAEAFETLEPEGEEEDLDLSELEEDIEGYKKDEEEVGSAGVAAD